MKEFMFYIRNQKDAKKSLSADEHLAFGKGLSTEDEPDLWKKDLTGAIDLWIEVGLPDERDIRKASGRSGKVVVVCYGGRGADIWWQQNRDRLERLRNLCVIGLAAESTQALAALANRNMQLQCTVQDGQVWLTDGQDTVHIEPAKLLDFNGTGYRS